MFRIGIDFDNTVACYDQAFVAAAGLSGICIDPSVPEKKYIKEQILSQEFGQVRWQRLQGKVYGKHINLARTFAGVHEFIYLAKERGHKVFIVSHKTEFGHFDEERIPLRSQALNWLRSNGLLGGTLNLLTLEDIFFEPTQAAKIARISRLKCTHFIDDLVEVLDSPDLSEKVVRILFDPSLKYGLNNGILGFSSWRGITNSILDDWTDGEICSVLRRELPKLKITEVERIRGRGNSRVMKVNTFGVKSYILKCYPDRQLDGRERLKVEFSALRSLFDLNFPVPEPVYSNEEFDWGLYENIAGTPAKADGRFVKNAADFIERIYLARRLILQFCEIGLASEACLSGSEIVNQIQLRLRKLNELNVDYLRDFIVDDFSPILDIAQTLAIQVVGKRFSEVLIKAHQLPSPGDFGAHNAIKSNAHGIIFIDFEYFGWDDPVKLVSDFYWHPAMELSISLRQEWLLRCKEIFSEDHFFLDRLRGYLPLFGLRWCLILLNEFVATALARRTFANPMGNVSKELLLREQFVKAARLLKLVKEHIDHGFAV